MKPLDLWNAWRETWIENQPLYWTVEKALADAVAAPLPWVDPKQHPAKAYVATMQGALKLKDESIVAACIRLSNIRATLESDFDQTRPADLSVWPKTYDALENPPPGCDRVLMLYIKAVEDSGPPEPSFPVTLTVGGVLYEGKLVSHREFYKHCACDLLSRSFPQNLLPDQQARRLRSPDVVHLLNVKVTCGAGSADLPWWRGRIDSISGFHIEG